MKVIFKKEKEMISIELFDALLMFSFTEDSLQQKLKLNNCLGHTNCRYPKDGRYMTKHRSTPISRESAA